MPEMRTVFSSHVAAIGHDSTTGELHITFSKTGRTVVYAGVPAAVAAQVMAAPSIGEALHRLVRGRFEHRYLKDGRA